jgi:hypothetical protein
MPETISQLRERALAGAGQAELLDQASAAGLDPYQASMAVADALHLHNLRPMVLEYMAADPTHRCTHTLRAQIRDSAAAGGAQTAGRQERESQIERELQAAVGDLAAWPWIRDALVDDDLIGSPSVPAELVRDCARSFAGASVLASSELASRISTRRGRRWTPKALADALGRYSIRPGRYRVNGTQVRGYRRADFEIEPRAC